MAVEVSYEYDSRASGFYGLEWDCGGLETLACALCWYMCVDAVASGLPLNEVFVCGHGRLPACR